jgi:hypothetical protein
MSYLHYLCLFAYNGVQHILCYVFALLFFVLLPSMLPVSLDCPFLIAPSVFSNVYVKVACIWHFKKGDLFEEAQCI